MEEFLYEISKDEINSLPLMTFEGDTILIDAEESVGSLADITSGMMIGFDTESRPSFRKGEHHPIALIQLATRDKAYLVRISRMGFPAELNRILSDGSITKIGLGTRSEIRDLEKACGIPLQGFIDLEMLAQKLKFKQRGVRALAAHFLKGRISKKAQKSNWERADLTPAQISYAATDAWIVLRIYEEMRAQGLAD